MIAALMICGCTLQQLATSGISSSASSTPLQLAAPSTASGSSIPSQSAATSSASPTTRPLPFTGRLIDGDATELPPAVAASLSPDSRVTFSYREELTHDDYHIPLFITALDPVTYVGAPLGDYGAKAFAALTIRDGDTVLGDYTAKAWVSKSYTLYSQPTHKQLDDEARAAVRQKIDEKLYHDAQRLSAAVTANAASARDNSAAK